MPIEESERGEEVELLILNEMERLERKEESHLQVFEGKPKR